LIEKRSDQWGEWTERWHVEAPNTDVRYRVTSDAWNDDYTVRDIYAIQQ
jgi:hypothetical protein